MKNLFVTIAGLILIGFFVYGTVSFTKSYNRGATAQVASTRTPSFLS